MKINRIILVAGDLNPIYSYEYHNFKDPLENMGYEVLTYDFKQTKYNTDREKINLELLTLVQNYIPDLVIFFPQTNELIPGIVDEINKYAKTLGYFYDDIWRVKFSNFWANHFNYVTTSHIYGVEKFKCSGVNNVLYSPFSCNTDYYSKINLPKIYDVSFVGAYNPQREWYINYLRRKGINVQVWGAGWGTKILTSKEMIEVFNQSRINLNLSNSISWNKKYLFEYKRSFRKTFHVLKNTLLSIFKSDIKNKEQVKGRHFEINACGGFQITYNVDGLDTLFKIDEEIITYTSPEELTQKIHYYLENEEERELIASRGLERVLNDHTAKKRIYKLLQDLSESY